MKFHLTLQIVALFAIFAFAQEPQKPVVVSYAEDTPQSVIDEAMEAIKKAGGVITHEYSIIKGFAAKATEKVLETVHALGEPNNVVIEEDQIISINS